MKLAEAIDTFGILGQLSQKPMGAKLSYAIGKNLRKLEPEIKLFEETRQKLVTTYAGEDGSILAENQEKADAEYKGLLETEITVDLHKVKLETFGSLEVTPAQMIALDCLIEE